MSALTRWHSYANLTHIPWRHTGCTKINLRQGFGKLSYYSLRMNAFSWTWSLPVTWQRWRSHHLIRHTQKPHAKCRPHGDIFHIGVTGDQSLHCGNRHFLPFCPVTLTLTRWPSYTNMTRTPWRYTGRANGNFLCQGFQKLSSDRQTELTEIIKHAS